MMSFSLMSVLLSFFVLSKLALSLLLSDPSLHLSTAARGGSLSLSLTCCRRWTTKAIFLPPNPKTATLKSWMWVFLHQPVEHVSITAPRPWQPLLYHPGAGHFRSRSRRRSKKQNVSTSNSGSMPSLAHKDSLRNGVYPKSQGSLLPAATLQYTPCASVTSQYAGGYVYESDTEGQYSVNPSYSRPPTCRIYDRPKGLQQVLSEGEVRPGTPIIHTPLRLPAEARQVRAHHQKHPTGLSGRAPARLVPAGLWAEGAGPQRTDL